MEIIPNGIESYWIEHAKSKHVSSIPRSLLFIGVFNDNKNILATMKVVENLSSRYEVYILHWLAEEVINMKGS